jgi:phosphoenolpyruvate synthase/pyruvate phosphate dikinase
MINPKKKLWRWGPIDGRPVYPDAWYVGMTANKKMFSPGWPANYSLYKGDRYSFVCDYDLLYKNGKTIFAKFILNDKFFIKSYQRWQAVAKKFAAINSKITPANLKKLNKDQLYKTILSWYKFYANEFWGLGLLPEIANFGGEVLLEEIVKAGLIPADKFVTVMEKLSAPEALSFYQNEERELIKLYLVKNQSSLTKALLKHQQKYYWLLNSYHATRVLPPSYFLKRLKKLSKSQARLKLGEINKFPKLAKLEKQRIIKKYNLSRQTLKVAQRLAFCIWWQDNRKSYIFQANHTIDVILRELAGRYKVNLEDLHYYNFNQIIRLGKDGYKLSIQQAKQHKAYFVVEWRPQAPTRYVFGSKAAKIFNKYQSDKKINQLTKLVGQPVSAGVARGRVRVILSPRQAGECKKGDILVTTMTSPDFIVAMRKAAAIVTDVGGLTSHAAIVSRELGIPCIVGTGLATRVLKTGERVEVDANHGLVRKL